MGLFRPSRTARTGRWLEWKVRIFVTGAVLGLAGIFLENRGLVTGALVVLAAGAALRLLPQKNRGDNVEGDDADDADEGLPSDDSSTVVGDEHSTA